MILGAGVEVRPSHLHSEHSGQHVDAPPWGWVMLTWGRGLLAYRSSGSINSLTYEIGGGGVPVLSHQCLTLPRPHSTEQHVTASGSLHRLFCRTGKTPLTTL